VVLYLACIFSCELIPWIERELLSKSGSYVWCPLKLDVGFGSLSLWVDIFFYHACLVFYRDYILLTASTHSVSHVRFLDRLKSHKKVWLYTRWELNPVFSQWRTHQEDSAEYPPSVGAISRLFSLHFIKSG